MKNKLTPVYVLTVQSKNNYPVFLAVFSSASAGLAAKEKYLKEWPEGDIRVKEHLI